MGGIKYRGEILILLMLGCFVFFCSLGGGIIK